MIMNTEKVVHNIPPVFDKNSKVLVLGSFPSPKSRTFGFFYGHPQNRFWKVLSSVLKCELPQSTEEKKNMLLANGIALWDVLESCEIKGAADSSIKNPQPNDLGRIFSAADIKAVFMTGKAAYRYYEKFFAAKYDVPFFLLPSPSSANCANYTVEMLVLKYEKLLEYI